MYTETELREALQHSAARIDDELDELPARTDDRGAAETEAAPMLGTVRVRRSWRPAIAAAAVVVAAGAGGLATHLARGTGPVAAPSAAATLVRPATKAASPATRPHTPVRLNNLVSIGNPNAHPDYELAATTDPEIVDLGTGAVVLIALPPTAAFDPATSMPGAERVDVAGTRGYYGPVTTSLLGQPAGKSGPPRATLAWSAPNGVWIFIRSGTNRLNLPLSTLLSHYRAMGLSVEPAPLRVPLSTGWLPAGLSVTAADIQPGVAAPYLELTSGAREVDIQVTPPRSVLGPPIPIEGEPSVHRDLDGFHVTVSVDGYSRAVAQRILDNLDLSRLPGGDANWWTLVDAVNGGS